MTQNQLQSLIVSLPSSWFTHSQEVIAAFEKQAENDINAGLLHEYLAKYFHLAGDYERAAFYAVHCEPPMDLQQKTLFSSAVVQTLLDYYIYANGGGLNGTVVMRSESIQVVDQLKTANASQNIYQTTMSPRKEKQRPPFWLLEQLKPEKVKKIIDQVVASSSAEAVLSFKVHVKQLVEEDLNTMSDQHLQIVKADVVGHEDQAYKQKILLHISQLYLKKTNIPEAVDCIIATKDSQAAADFLIAFLNKQKWNLAIQTAFDFQERLPQVLITDIQYKLNQSQHKSDCCQLIIDEVLTGKITTQLYLDFMQINQHIDRSALRELSKASTIPESVSSCFLMHSLMTISTLQYDHKDSIIAQLQKYPLFAFYSEIGLIFRGHFELPETFTKTLQNINSADPYALGGSILGMAFQLVGMNTSDNNALIKLLELNDQIDSISDDKRGPIVHGLALALGLVTLGQSSEDVNELLMKRFGDNVDANQALLIGLGLSNFAHVEFYKDEKCQKIISMLSSEKQKERDAAGLALALLCFRQESRADELIEFLETFSQQNPGQFADSAASYASLGLGLAYFQTNNVQQCQRLLMMANKLSKTNGAALAIQSIGFILKGSPQTLQLLQMCTRSFDAHIRAGACMAMGQIFANSANQKVVETLCKLMADQEEIVRCAAILAQAMVLQSICGVELPDAQKIEYDEPVGDRQKNCIYKCDYKDEDEFEKVKNQQKLYKTPSPLSERSKENYATKIVRQLTINEYATQFRRDLVKEDETHPLTQRHMWLALGILNAGGLNLSFQLKSDLQVASYTLFMNSFTWYPLMATIGLCMEPDLMSCVVFNGKNLDKVEPVVSIPTALVQKYGYSVLSKEVRQAELTQYIQKARLSQQDLKDEKASANRFKFMRQVRNIAMEEFARQASNVKLSEVLADAKKEEINVSDEFQILQAPVRIVNEMVDNVKFVAGGGYKFVSTIKKGVVVVEEEEE